MTKTIITLIAVLSRQASLRTSAGRRPHMLSDSRTELPKDIKTQFPLGWRCEQGAGWLPSSVSGCRPERQNGSEAEARGVMDRMVELPPTLAHGGGDQVSHALSPWPCLVPLCFPSQQPDPPATASMLHLSWTCSLPTPITCRPDTTLAIVVTSPLWGIFPSHSPRPPGSQGHCHGCPEQNHV